MSTYIHKGICLESELEFPELQPSDHEPEVRLRLDALDLSSIDAPPFPCWTQTTSDETVFVWDELGSVRLRAGREITVDPSPGASQELLHMALLGPVFSVLCFQRGMFPLHASSLWVRDRAIAIVGPSGAGKTTLAAGMVARGHRLIADDVSALRVHGGASEVFPSIARLRLTPATKAWLEGRSNELDALPDGQANPLDRDPLDPESLDPSPHRPNPIEKEFRSVPGLVSAEPVPLADIYVLQDGAEPAIEAMSPQQAFLEIMGNGHRPELLVASVGEEAFMHRCAEVARSLCVRRLIRPRSFQRLPELARLLEEASSG